MNKAAIMRQKVGKVIPMLAQRKIKVTQQGTGAYTKFTKDGRIEAINLPYIPDDASDDFLGAIEGYLDHEVGHSLFTDHEVIAQSIKSGVKSLCNLIEDTFIERKMTQEFKGCGANLDAVGKFFLREHTDKAIEKGGVDAVGAVMVPAVRALAGQSLYRDYMADKWGIVEEPMGRAREYLARELPNITCSADSLRVAIEAKRLLASDPVDSDPSGPAESSPEKRESGGADGEPREAGEADERSEPGKSSDDKNDSPGAGDPDDAGSSSEPGERSEDEANGESGEPSSGDGDDGDDGDPDGASPEQPSDAPSEKPGGEPEDTKDSIADSSELSSFDGSISSLLSKMSEEAIVHSDYAVWSTDFDKIGEPIEATFNEVMVGDMLSKVDHMVGPLQKDLERAVAARSKALWSPGHRSGRLHGAALSRMIVFGDDRVFRRRYEHYTNDVAVSLLVDCSGSMANDGRIKTACNAAYALASVLSRIRVASEVIGFTTGDGIRRQSSDEAARLGIRYGRYETLVMPLFKGFDEAVTPVVKNRLAVAPAILDLSNNVDGECVQIAALRLAKRREKRKVLMVLSDGYPACAGSNRSHLNGHLVRVVKDVAASGIDVLGIGIDSDSVKRFYPKSVVLRNVADLPGAVIGEIKKLLII